MVLARAALFAFDVQREIVQPPNAKEGRPSSPPSVLPAVWFKRVRPRRQANSTRLRPRRRSPVRLATPRREPLTWPCYSRRRPSKKRPHLGSGREPLGVTKPPPGWNSLEPGAIVGGWRTMGGGPCRRVQPQRSLKPSLAIACSLQRKPTPPSFVRDYSAWPAIGCGRPWKRTTRRHQLIAL
jgi:hypothetical protein